MEFYKYQGAGNDFILIDDRGEQFPEEAFDKVAKMCDRHFGIGADGLMLLRNAEGYDFEMIYYNSDGNYSSMCGNGGRCITQFASDLGLVDEVANFLAVDGPHEAKLHGGGRISLQMNNVSMIEEINRNAVLLDTGSPHYVTQKSNISELDMLALGKEIRFGERFRDKGVNVNAIEWKDNVMHIRTYERGVENETLACGTGVVAAAIAAHHWGFTDSPVKVKARGGDLEVKFSFMDGIYSNIWKTGPVGFAFKGNYEL